MAEGFQEPYHVPQQSRRDKLRANDGASLLPLPSDLLTCTMNTVHGFETNPFSLSLSSHNQTIRSYVGSSSLGPVGPFTGYGSILKGSRFLGPTQQMLEEVCQVARGGMYDMGIEDEIDLGESEVGDDGEGRRKKSRLISLLDEVYKRYKYYYQQIQGVVASFESVPGLSNAAPFANLALKAMSRLFRTLKNAIIDQLHFANKPHPNSQKGDNTVFGDSDRIICFGQRSGQNAGLYDNQPVWRPQRGLPERAVTVLRAWLFDHFLHPYPTDTDKMMLAKQTGLSRNQVSNWFINARVRIWKPMVEEIHNLDTRQADKNSELCEHNADVVNNDFSATTSLGSQSMTTFANKTLELSSKRAKNELRRMASSGTEEPMCSYYEQLPNHQVLMGGGTSNPSGTGNVSLTLGLYQNHGIGISEPFPINAARRFGLDANTQGYVSGNYETRSREFGRDFIGGQLFHDFVG